MDARNIEATEKIYEDITSGKLKATDVDGDTYKRVVENNRLWEDVWLTQ